MQEKDRKKLYKLFKERFNTVRFNKDESKVDCYTSLRNEYESIRKGVGVYNISTSSFLELRGNDVLDFVHRISTNSTKELDILEKVNTLFTNEKGRIIDRTTLLFLEEFYLLIGSEQRSDLLQSWLDRYIISEDIRFESANDKYILLEIIGPQAESYLTIFCGDCLGGLVENKLFEIDFEGIIINVMKFKEINGSNKFWVLSESGNAFNLLTNLIDKRSVFDMNLIGEEAYELYRISDGIPKAPNELNDSFNPHEVNLIGEVDFEKGCYIGQEVIARLDTYDKVQRMLKKIRLDYEFEIGEGSQITDDRDNEAGTVTSLTKSELKKETIGLALVRRKYLDTDSKLYIYDKSGEKVPLTIVGK